MQFFELTPDVGNRSDMVLQKPLNVYMMCSLYASVQDIDDSPFLPHGAVHSLQLHL